MFDYIRDIKWNDVRFLNPQIIENELHNSKATIVTFKNSFRLSEELPRTAHKSQCLCRTLSVTQHRRPPIIQGRLWVSQPWQPIRYCVSYIASPLFQLPEFVAIDRSVSTQKRKHFWKGGRPGFSTATRRRPRGPLRTVCPGSSPKSYNSAIFFLIRCSVSVFNSFFYPICSSFITSRWL